MIDEDRLWAECATLAYHFGWSLDEVLDLEHPVRARMLQELARLLDQSPPD